MEIKRTENTNIFRQLTLSGISFIFSLMILNGLPSIAQNNPGDSLFRGESVKDFELPPLDSLIQAALSNSGNYLYFVEDLKLKQEELRLQNKVWFDYLDVNGNLGYGHNDQLFFNQYSYDHEYSMLSNSKQLNYYAGLTVKVPVSALFNHGNQVKIAHYNVNKAEGEAKKAGDQVALLVIELYYTTLSNYKTMVISQSQLQSSRIEMEKAEKDFMDGRLTLNSYSVIVRNYYKQEADFEKSKGEFIQVLNKLEWITGLKITQNL